MQPLLYKAGSTWKQMGYKADVMRAHKNFLFAIGITNGANYYPNQYWWSHPADNNGLPYTWDPTDLASIAGSSNILGNIGNLVDGLSLRDSFCLYTTNGITLLDFVGGTFIWNARGLSTNAGLITPNAVVDISGNHIFLSDGDILINDGNSVRSVLHRVARTKLQGAISAANYHHAYAVTNPTDKEVWFCIPNTGSTYANVAIIYNWQDDKVSLRDLNRSYAAMTYGPISFSALTWGNVQGSWGSYPYNWNYSSSSPFANQLIAVDATNSTLYSTSNTDGSLTLNTVIERDSVVFGSQREVTTIVRAYPHIDCTGPVSIQLGSQDFVDGPIRWKPAVTFYPTAQRKVDIRTTGKLHAWIISSLGATPFKYSGMDIEYVNNGVR
jgi:hypothetical protein